MFFPRSSLFLILVRRAGRTTTPPTFALGRGARARKNARVCGFHTTPVFRRIYLINRDREACGSVSERNGSEISVTWNEERTRERPGIGWKENGEKRGAQVAHTWCTVVREVRFLSTSLQFYRSGRVSLCLYIYIQGDPRNATFPFLDGIIVGAVSMDGMTELGDNVYRQKVSLGTDWYYVGMKSCECLVLGMRRSVQFYPAIWLLYRDNIYNRARRYSLSSFIGINNFDELYLLTLLLSLHRQSLLLRLEIFFIVTRANEEFWRRILLHFSEFIGTRFCTILIVQEEGQYWPWY